MAITKNQETVYGTGFDINHHVLVNITIDKDSDQLKLNLSSFSAASNYNDGDHPIRKRVWHVAKADIPTAVLLDIKAMLESIEDEIINHVPAFEDGVRVKDNGAPIT